MSKTIVYSYKGIVGIKTPEDATGIMNNPNNGNKMIYLIDASHVDISAEALSLLKQIPCGTQSVSDIMSYSVKVGGEEKIVFGFTNGPLRIICKMKTKKGSEDLIPLCGDINFNPGLLTATEGIEVDKSFKNFVDKMEKDGKLDKIKFYHDPA